MNDLTGTVVDVVTFGVERGKIREFARATHATDPVHCDPELAQHGGFADVPATATHVVVSGHYRDQHEWVANLGLELSRVVVGSVNWRYRRPLTAGDVLTGTRRVMADETKAGRRGGTMRLLTLQTDFIDSQGEVAVTQQEILIERPPG
jgi:acyl dehydratase